MKIKARAKINLTLDVMGTRSDGYHEILTIMQALELHDKLEVETNPDGLIEVECSHPDVPSGKENLVFKAADILRKEYGCSMGAKISIRKHIPVAAGLAGGSADAAAVLKALNRLWDLNASESELQKVGEKIGSDIPFCITGGTALARGRGELLTPLPSFSDIGVVVVKPPFSVSTAKVYSMIDNFPGNSGPDLREVVQAIENRDYKAVAGMMNNALERVTTYLHPEILEIKEALIGAGAAGSLMSGSGPAVFGLCRDPEEALIVASRLDLPDCRIIANFTV
ncbi:MAG: 4-(cytidine 5'-diphospho)-2-C-methyl-D-erythritol kinase [Bacillota bacterium]